MSPSATSADDANRHQPWALLDYRLGFRYAGHFVLLGICLKRCLAMTYQLLSKLIESRNLQEGNTI
jgi:hypothetical protein